MSLKNSLRGFGLFANHFRTYSSGAPLVDVAVNDKTGVATVSWQRPPVNSFNLELLTAFKKVLNELENNKCRGMILTSNSKNVYSAGLDILEMYKPEKDRLKAFWTTLQDVWIALYGSSYPTVAAINGHSPAGGCLMSLSCEYRVMVNNFTIGLNETHLGITAPFWFASSMRNVIGMRQTELALTTGKLFTTDEALKVGLVDEVAESKEDAIAKAEAFLQKFAKIPSHARGITKKSVREKDIQELVQNQEKDVGYFTTFIVQDKVQKALGLYLEALKQRQKQ